MARRRRAGPAAAGQLGFTDAGESKRVYTRCRHFMVGVSHRPPWSAAGFALSRPTNSSATRVLWCTEWSAKRQDRAGHGKSGWLDGAAGTGAVC